MAFFDMNTCIKLNPIFYKGNLFIFNSLDRSVTIPLPIPMINCTCGTISNLAPNYNDLRNHINGNFCHIVTGSDFENTENKLDEIMYIIDQSIMLAEKKYLSFDYIVISINTVINFYNINITNPSFYRKSFIDIDWGEPDPKYDDIGNLLITFGFHKITDNWYYINIHDDKLNANCLTKENKTSQKDIDETDPEEIIDRVFKDIPCE